MFGATCYAYYRVKKIFYLISIAMDSKILDQLTNLGSDVDSEFPKPNLFLLLTMFGATCYAYYRVRKIFYLISIVMDSKILDQLTNLGRDVDSEFPKPKRNRNNRRLKKADTKINELEDNDVIDKRERLVVCVLSGNSKMYLGKEDTEQQIN